MLAGTLRERVALQSRQTTRDVIGGEVVTWNAEGCVWASVLAVTGREAAVASQIDAVTNLKVTIRYREDVAATWRILWRHQVLSVEAVLPSPARDQITLLCSEGLNQG